MWPWNVLGVNKKEVHRTEMLYAYNWRKQCLGLHPGEEQNVLPAGNALK
jgi:hypothetical protein